VNVSKGQSLKEKAERQLIVDEIVTATAGLGLQGVARTVSGHVRLTILHARRARAVAALQSRMLTPKPAPLSDEYDPEVELG
jgi:hypothetical protein